MSSHSSAVQRLPPCTGLTLGVLCPSPPTSERPSQLLVHPVHSWQALMLLCSYACMLSAPRLRLGLLGLQLYLDERGIPPSSRHISKSNNKQPVGESFSRSETVELPAPGVPPVDTSTADKNSFIDPAVGLLHSGVLESGSARRLLLLGSAHFAHKSTSHLNARLIMSNKEGVSML